MDEKQKKEWAKKRVKELKDYYTHLIVYLMVNIILFVINWVSGGAWWFYWVTIFWGIGVFIHTVSVLVEGQFLGKNWEEKKYKELTGEEKDTEEEKDKD